MATATYIDPMGSPALAAKYKKALEKGKLSAVRLEFTAAGFAALAATAANPGTFVPIAEAMASISGPAGQETRPYEDEKKYLTTRYETRLDEEAPASMREAADKAALDAAVAALPFQKRRALQMSNQEFEYAFSFWENGVGKRREPAEADRLRQEHAQMKGTRGRGRGGRGRGSFRGAEAPKNEGPKGPEAPKSG